MERWDVLTALQRAQMNNEQLKMRNDQAALRFQRLAQTENFQVVVWFLLLLPDYFNLFHCFIC